MTAKQARALLCRANDTQLKKNRKAILDAIKKRAESGSMYLWVNQTVPGPYLYFNEDNRQFFIDLGYKLNTNQNEIVTLISWKE